MPLQFIALALPIAAAYGVLNRLPCFRGDDAGRAWTVLSLSAGIGLGVASCFFFAWLALFGVVDRWYFVAESVVYGLCIVSAIAAARRSPIKLQQLRQANDVASFSDRGARGAIILFGLLAAVGFWLAWRAHPHGDWDAWAIWNLRARFLFRGGPQWTDTFAPPLSWTHADYPLLIPASVARLWYWGGAETTVTPALIAFFYSAATVGLLASSVTKFGGLAQGCFGALAMIGNEFFLNQAASLYADIPLAFFILAAVVMLARAVESRENAASALALAGLACGLAAWTKNEGFLALLCAIAAWALVSWRSHSIRLACRGLAPLALGLVVPLAVVAWFKLRYAPSNDLIAAASSTAVAARLSDGARYLNIAGQFLYQIIGFGDGLVASLPLVAIVLGRRATGPHRPAAAMATIAVILIACGYFFTYLVSPHDLNWHLRTSLRRLLLHVYPAMLLAFFLYFDSPPGPVLHRAPRQAAAQ